MSSALCVTFPFEVRRQQRGSVFIMVLWVCLALVSIALLFGHSMKMSLRGAANDTAGHQAQQAIEGAARYATYLLSNLETRGALPAVGSYSAEQIPIGDSYCWFLGKSMDQTNDPQPVYGLIDEASKLNLNTATAEMLQLLPGMTQELSYAIIDWRDSDDEITQNGAESETYLRLNPARLCKNAAFESPGELALVSGATLEVLEGNSNNMINGIIDRGISDYVTVFSREPNTRPDGSARINVNTGATDLNALMTDSFGATRASQIALNLPRRRNFQSLLEFFIRSRMTEAEFDKINGEITVKDGSYLVGLVNVNTASETVLSCIPGILAEDASKLVAARAARSSAGIGIAWVVAAIGEEKATQAGPYLTGQSWQATADIAAVGKSSRGYRRTRFVLDNSTGQTRMIYRQNLARLGWALGADVRRKLATLGNQP